MGNHRFWSNKCAYLCSAFGTAHPKHNGFGKKEFLTSFVSKSWIFIIYYWRLREFLVENPNFPLFLQFLESAATWSQHIFRFFDLRLRKLPRTTISLESKWPLEYGILKNVDFDQKNHEVPLSKILKSEKCFCLKWPTEITWLFFDKTTIFCSIFVRKKKIQKSCWSIRLWVF